MRVQVALISSETLRPALTYSFHSHLVAALNSRPIHKDSSLLLHRSPHAAGGQTLFSSCALMKLSHRRTNWGLGGCEVGRRWAGLGAWP